MFGVGCGLVRETSVLMLSQYFKRSAINITGQMDCNIYVPGYFKHIEQIWSFPFVWFMLFYGIWYLSLSSVAFEAYPFFENMIVLI